MNKKHGFALIFKCPFIHSGCGDDPEIAALWAAMDEARSLDSRLDCRVISLSLWILFLVEPLPANDDCFDEVVGI